MTVCDVCAYWLSDIAETASTEVKRALFSAADCGSSGSTNARIAAIAAARLPAPRMILLTVLSWPKALITDFHQGIGVGEIGCAMAASFVGQRAPRVD